MHSRRASTACRNKSSSTFNLECCDLMQLWNVGGISNDLKNVYARGLWSDSSRDLCRGFYGLWRQRWFKQRNPFTGRRRHLSQSALSEMVERVRQVAPERQD